MPTSSPVSADPTTVTASAHGGRGIRYAIGGWALLVAACLAFGHVLRAHGLLHLDAAPPFHGAWRLVPLSWQLLPAIAYAAAAIVVLPRLTRMVRWRLLLLLCWGGTTGWAVLLATSAGARALLTPLSYRVEYLGVASAVGDDPLRWLHGFAGHVGGYPTHVAGHPPLPVLLFWLPHALGLPIGPAAAALCILLGSSASAAVLVTARQLLGEDRARTIAPYLLLAPYVLTVATSADAMFLGITAWGIAVLAIAAVRGSFAVGVAAGLLLGMTPYLNYGLLPIGAVAVAVVVLRPSRAALVGAIVGCVVVAIAFTAGGFWWPDGVAATHARWATGDGSKRPYPYVLFANLALLAVLTGPATAAGLARLRDRRSWVLVGGALLAVAVLDASGVTRLEVERIWLAFAPWTMLATGALSRSSVRGWLIAQAGVAILVQGLVGLRW